LEVLLDRQPSRACKYFDTVEVNHSFVTLSHV
jgi:hypothetical protein